MDIFAGVGSDSLALDVPSPRIKTEAVAVKAELVEAARAVTAAAPLPASGVSQVSTSAPVKSDTGTSQSSAAAIPLRRDVSVKAEQGASEELPMEERVRQLIAHEFEMDVVERLIGEIHGRLQADSAVLHVPSTTRKLKTIKCNACGNADEKYFVADAKEGTTICAGKDGRGCGIVLQEHNCEEGSEFRKFAEEEDKNHHGPAANHLMSGAFNLQTKIGGSSAPPARGRGLQGLMQVVELNLSQYGKDDKRTREGYKDNMKRKAFAQIGHCAKSLRLHECVVQIASEMFARWRDLKEHVQQYEAVVAACIIFAWRKSGNQMRAETRDVQLPNGYVMKVAVGGPKAKTYICAACGGEFGSQRERRLHDCPASAAAKKRTALQEGTAAGGADELRVKRHRGAKRDCIAALMDDLDSDSD